MIEIIIGILLGCCIGIGIEYFLLMQKNVKLQKEIGRLEGKLAVNNIMSILAKVAVPELLKILFLPRPIQEKNNGVKSKRKNNIHKRP